MTGVPARVREPREKPVTCEHHESREMQVAQVVRVTKGDKGTTQVTEGDARWLRVFGAF